jgi:hypothetical protein
MFAVEIFWEEGKELCVYTVRDVEDDTSLTEYFFDKFISDPQYENEARKLSEFIVQALVNEPLNFKNYRPENFAYGLPPTGKFQIDSLRYEFYKPPLRLYCLPISPCILVLFGGEEKTSLTAQDGKTSYSFQQAQIYAKKINESIRDGIIYVHTPSKRLRTFDDKLEIIL